MCNPYPLCNNFDLYPQERYHAHARIALRAFAHLRTLRRVRALRAAK